MSGMPQIPKKASVFLLFSGASVSPQLCQGIFNKMENDAPKIWKPMTAWESIIGFRGGEGRNFISRESWEIRTTDIT